jgi:hypothetical protein
VASDAELPLSVGLSKAGRPSGDQLPDKAVGRRVCVAAEDAGLKGWQRFSGRSSRTGLVAAAGEAMTYEVSAQNGLVLSTHRRSSRSNRPLM